MRTSRLASIAGLTAVAVLSGCYTRPVVISSPPVVMPSAVAVTPAPAIVGVEYGRVTNIEFFQAGAVYRVTIQTDPGGLRTYDVPSTGDLRVGDRVRVDAGVIYRA